MPLDRIEFADADAILDDHQAISRIRFLNHIWAHGALPEDSRQLSRIAKNPARVWCTIMGEFTHRPSGGWTHPSLTEHAERAADISEKRRAAAEVMWGRRRDAIASAHAAQEQCYAGVSVNVDRTETRRRPSKASKERSTEASGGTSRVRLVGGTDV